jgi:hypothetical protein
MTSFEKLKTKLAGAMESPRETTEESPIGWFYDFFVFFVSFVVKKVRVF